MHQTRPRDVDARRRTRPTEYKKVALVKQAAALLKLYYVSGSAVQTNKDNQQWIYRAKSINFLLTNAFRHLCVIIVPWLVYSIEQ